MMLAVRRPGVTVAARSLQTIGAIDYERGRISSATESAWRKPPASATASFESNFVAYWVGPQRRIKRKKRDWNKNRTS